MSIMSDAKSYYKYLQEITDRNNAESSKQADKMMAFQREMSDTAHQREVADLKAAGLNPVLSAGGQGASSPQGAMGQTDMSAASALTQYLGSLINQQTAISVAQINAGAAKYAADMSASNPNSWAGIVRSLVLGNGVKESAVNKFLNAIDPDSTLGKNVAADINVLKNGSSASASQAAVSRIQRLYNWHKSYDTYVYNTDKTYANKYGRNTEAYKDAMRSFYQNNSFSQWLSRQPGYGAVVSGWRSR